MHNPFDSASLDKTLDKQGKSPQVLLGMKKRGFGEGKWNGLGGKVDPGEDIEVAAKRELLEETGLVANELYKVGTLDFSWQDKPLDSHGKPEILEVHIFKTDKFEGKPIESEEMRPAWFHVNDIPFDQMWADDKHWMHLLLADKKFRGRFIFDDSNNVIDHEITEIREA